MRRAIVLAAILVLLFLTYETLVYADSDLSWGAKHTVAILPVVNNGGLHGDHYTVDMIEDKMADKFGNGKYTVLSGQTLSDSLRREGIDDVRAVDNSTLVPVLKRLHVDYVVRTELLFVVTDQKLSLPSALLFIKSWTATVPLYANITDVNQGTVLYDATIVENGRHEAIIGFARQSSAVKSALAKALERFDRESWIPE
jgi:hypothetical protein